MEKILRMLWAILFIAVSGVAYSQDATSANERPKVGLVLSGGGAKGAAHIGVLKYIEEMGIPIDYIAGTSMGSIVGGMYALGYSSDEILAIISDVDWDKLISNQVDRRRISYTRKAESRTQLVTIPFAFGTDAQELKSRSFKNSLPSGIVSGDNLINLFNSLTVGYSDPIDFNDLPIPFLCIATNVINGKADALNKGVLSKSLRASMAIPILFDPVKIDNTLYADGGLLNNFPAEQCRAMGADYVIGVSMSPGLESNPDNLSSLFSQVKQLQEFVANPNKRGGGPHNYGIAVDVTLVDCTGHPLPMGSEYDYFGDRARVDIEEKLFKSGEITYRELKNRQLLREIMTEAGWLTIPSEWWHFNAMPLRVASQKLTVIQ